MFPSVGWGEMLILLAAGLIILGPERLPGAVSWTMQSIRKARDYATGATDQLKNELGPEFDDLRKPLSDLNELRGMSPKSLITKHLLDGDDSVFTAGLGSFTVDRSVSGTPPIKPVSQVVPTGPDLTKSAGTTKSADSSKPGTNGAGVDGAAPRRNVADWDAT